MAPVALASPSFVAVQRPYACGYDTEYLGWVFNREELIETVSGLGMELARELRVARYLDNRLKLAAQLRDSELDEAWKAQGGQGDREALRLKLSKEKYERMLTELLAELRRRANVRIVDPLDDATRSVAERP